MDEIRGIQKKIDEEINAVLRGYCLLDKSFLNAVQYVLSLKGKRIRPLLMILSYRLFKDDINAVFNQAVALELFHNFTLVHDDIMDNSDRRRGKETVNNLWGNDVAILVGDILLVQAHKLLLSTSGKFMNDIMSVFIDMSMKLCEGQFIDIKGAYEVASTDQYIYMIKGKTAVLLASCLEIGAILGEASANDRKMLYELGINLGIAFQIEDDLLDVYSEQSVCGKNVKRDILNKKKTFLLIKAMECGDNEQKKKIYDYLHTTNVTPYMVDEIKQIYDTLRISEQCKRIASQYYLAAENCIKSLSVKEQAKESLRYFIKLLQNRKS